MVRYRCIFVVAGIHKLEEAIASGNRREFWSTLGAQEDTAIALFGLMKRFSKTGTREREWFMNHPGMFMTVINAMQEYRRREVSFLEDRYSEDCKT